MFFSLDVRPNWNSTSTRPIQDGFAEGGGETGGERKRRGIGSGINHFPISVRHAYLLRLIIFVRFSFSLQS